MAEEGFLSEEFLKNEEEGLEFSEAMEARDDEPLFSEISLEDEGVALLWPDDSRPDKGLRFTGGWRLVLVW